MKAILLRTVSAPVHVPASLGFPRVAFSDHESGAGISFSGWSYASSRRFALHFEMKEKRRLSQSRTLRRAMSEADMASLGGTASEEKLSLSFPPAIPEEGALEGKHDLNGKAEAGGGAAVLERKVLGFGVSDSVSEALPMVEAYTLSGGGSGEGRRVGGGRGVSDGIVDVAGGSADQCLIGAYYEEMVKLYPEDPLLLRNYGKYLHEVEKDALKAEEYYARAILQASPGDGELLALYGKLIWETQRDPIRAQGYFEQAIKASPNNSYVLGSYAYFLWGVEEEEVSPLVAAC